IMLRLILLNIYIVLSPVMVIAWAIPMPAAQEMAKGWVKGLLGVIFIQLVQVVALTVGISFVQGLTAHLSGLDHTLVAFVGSVAIIWLIMRAPSMFGVSALASASSFAAGVGAVLVGGVAATAYSNGIGMIGKTVNTWANRVARGGGRDRG